ncbi:MAG TPA: response regulator [Gammaproteobacteria bacterium]|nr:response regulator [Gammaproteobacteria bacterium]
MQRTLLLVDDEENIRRSLVRVLRRNAYHILQADGGEEGLAVLQEHPDVGVIISDQRMPEMTGIEFLARVREACPDTVRIILSGYTDLNTVTEAINEGAVYKFLTKPWEDDLLRANVEEAFRYYELGRENERLTCELKSANEELAIINQDLEQRVEEKTRQVLLNTHFLKISQEVLEYLPAGVLGMDNEGTIVLANRQAHILLNHEKQELMGQTVVAVLPQALAELFQLAVEKKQAHALRVELENIIVDVQCCCMGQSSQAEGAIIVLTAVT